jgi:hypothetical protein
MHFVSSWDAPDIGLPWVTVKRLIMPLPAKQGNALLESVMRAIKRPVANHARDKASARARNPRTGFGDDGYLKRWSP